MFKKSSFLVLIATTLLLVAADAAYAQGPKLVPRLMMMWETNEPLDWEAEGSVALIAKPGDITGHQIAPIDDYGYQLEGIYSTLTRNLPNLSEDEIDALTTTVADNFGWFSNGPHLMHVRTGGPEVIDGNRLYWGAGIPATGAVAHAGPAGHVTVLGPFYFSTDSAMGLSLFPNGSDLVIVDQQDALYTVQLAIGWFNK